MKIKVGKKEFKRSLHNLTHDVNTTSEWGFMQPLTSITCIGNSKVKLTPHTFVRLAPLVKPTFGRAVLKHYAYFVTKRDVMMSYENLVSGEIYNGGGSSYVPAQEPSIGVNQPGLMLLTLCTFTVYKGTHTTSGAVDIYSNTQIVSTQAAVTTAVNQFNTTYDVGSVSQVVQASLWTGISDPISPNGADFVICDGDYIFCFRLTLAGQRLRKIFLGLGYQVIFENPLNEYVSILPLLAYYKAWFDLFAVKQTKNWQSTKAYQLIQKVAYSAIEVLGASDFSTLVWPFVAELLTTYYTNNPDYFTAHQSSLNNVMTGYGRVVTTTASSPDVNTIGAAAVENKGVTGVTGLSTSAISPIAIKLALRLLPWANKNSVIGQRMREYFKAHGLGQVDDNKLGGFVGATSVNIDISDVMQTAETAEGTLGEYAGKGIGTNSGSAKTFEYDVKAPGYFIVLTTVVPRAGYCQGFDPNLFNTRRQQQYDPDFDALGMQGTSKIAYCGSVDVVGRKVPARFGTFGFIPTFSEYKQHQNICNGDFSRRGVRNEMLPFVLDRWFTLGEITQTGDSRWEVQNSTLPQVSEVLREVGRNDFFGNYNRIFNSIAAGADPFLIHNVVECKYFAPMLPMADSFDTDSFDNSLTIEKS